MVSLDDFPKTYDEVAEWVRGTLATVDVALTMLDLNLLDEVMLILSNLVELCELGQHSFSDSATGDYAGLLADVRAMRDRVLLSDEATAVIESQSLNHRIHVVDFVKKFLAQAKIAGSHLSVPDREKLQEIRQMRERLAGEGKKLVARMDDQVHLVIPAAEVLSWETLPESLHKDLQPDNSLLMTSANYSQLIQFCPNPTMRLVMYMSRFSGRQLVMPLAAEFFQVVQEEAVLLGEEMSWTGWAVYGEGGGRTADRLLQFIDDSRDALYLVAKSEMAVWKAATREDQIFNYEWEYYTQKMRRLLAEDTEDTVALEVLMAAIFNVLDKWFGLECSWSTWKNGFAPNLTLVTVKKDGEVIGQTVFDLYTREAKVRNAFHYTLQSIQPPMIDLIAMNLDFPGEGMPTIITLRDARNIMHEFVGHSLQRMLIDPELPYRWSATKFGTMQVEILTRMAEQLMYHPDFPISLGDPEVAKVGEAILAHHELGVSKWFCNIFNKLQTSNDLFEPLIMKRFRDFWIKECFADVFDRPGCETPFTIPAWVHFWMRNYGPLYASYSYSRMVGAWLTDVSRREGGMSLIEKIYRRGDVGDYQSMLELVVGEPVDTGALGRQLSDMPIYAKWRGESKE